MASTSNGQLPVGLMTDEDGCYCDVANTGQETCLTSFRDRMEEEVLELFRDEAASSEENLVQRRHSESPTWTQTRDFLFESQSYADSDQGDQVGDAIAIEDLFNVTPSPTATDQDSLSSCSSSPLEGRYSVHMSENDDAQDSYYPNAGMYKSYGVSFGSQDSDSMSSNDAEEDIRYPYNPYLPFTSQQAYWDSLPYPPDHPMSGNDAEEEERRYTYNPYLPFGSQRTDLDSLLYPRNHRHRSAFPAPAAHSAFAQQVYQYNNAPAFPYPAYRQVPAYQAGHHRPMRAPLGQMAMNNNVSAISPNGVVPDVPSSSMHEVQGRTTQEDMRGDERPTYTIIEKCEVRCEWTRASASNPDRRKQCTRVMELGDLEHHVFAAHLGIWQAVIDPNASLFTCSWKDCHDLEQRVSYAHLKSHFNNLHRDLTEEVKRRREIREGKRPSRSQHN